MPRRKKPFQLAVMGESVSSTDHVNRVRLIRGFLSSHSATRQCNKSSLDRMSPIIADAYQYARLDLGTVLNGKRVKPDAWRLDIFCSEVAQAWRNAGLDPEAWKWGDKQSSFVKFVGDVADFLGLKHGRESLINNVIRAKEIKRTG